MKRKIQKMVQIRKSNIDETDSEKVSFGQRITSKFHDITNKIKGIRGKLADLSGQAGKIKAALTDEHNRNSVSAIWKELKYLLKHSRFRKIDTEQFCTVGAVSDRTGTWNPCHVSGNLSV